MWSLVSSYFWKTFIGKYICSWSFLEQMIAWGSSNTLLKVDKMECFGSETFIARVTVFEPDEMCNVSRIFWGTSGLRVSGRATSELFNLM